MYKLLLILKYLRKRRLAWWSVLAVALCTTMVLVVMSVMGGWVEMFQESFHGLSGDIVIRAKRFQGMPCYEEIIARMRREMPELKDAAPVVEAFGVVNIGLPTDPNRTPQMEKGVQILGYPPNISDINGFTHTLHRLKDTDRLTFSLIPDHPYFPPPRYKGPDVNKWPGMIVGQGVIGIRRNTEGQWRGRESMYDGYVYLTVIPHELGGKPLSMSNSKEAAFWIIDDSRTKVALMDDRRVYVPFNVLQKLLLMDAYEDEPARTNEIQVALKPGADLNGAREKIRQIIREVWREARQRTGSDAIGEFGFPDVQTWREAYSTYLSAVENEKGLLAILFGLISLVAVFLIFCIFYMVVAEKTRDIGTIKSVGATPGGVAGIFLGYGAVIGVVGGLLGLLFSYLIVHNINELHGWLAAHGWVIWNPEVYLFDTIPDRMNPREATIIVTVAIIASIGGAIIPACRAALMHPVEALRWE